MTGNSLPVGESVVARYSIVLRLTCVLAYKIFEGPGARSAHAEAGSIDPPRQGALKATMMRSRARWRRGVVVTVRPACSASSLLNWMLRTSFACFVRNRLGCMNSAWLVP